MISRTYFATLVMIYVVNFPNFDFKSIIFPSFGQGPFHLIAGKSPEYDFMYTGKSFCWHTGSRAGGK